MLTKKFNSDNSVKGTTTSIITTQLGSNLYAYNTNLSSLSSDSKSIWYTCRGSSFAKYILCCVDVFSKKADKIP